MMEPGKLQGREISYFLGIYVILLSKYIYIYIFIVNFKNLILIMYIKFYSNKMLFIIRSINFFFMHNFRLQKLEILTFFY